MHCEHCLVLLLSLMMRRVSGFSHSLKAVHTNLLRLHCRSVGGSSTSHLEQVDSSKSSVTSSVHLAKHLWAQVIKPGDICIDATAGNGYDTLELVKLVFPISGGMDQRRRGAVYFFDIQSSAIRQTSERILDYQREGRREINLYHNSKSATPAPSSTEATVDELVQQLDAKVNGSTKDGVKKSKWDGEKPFQLYVNVRPMHCSHDMFPEEIKQDSVRCIVYNLGYLPTKNGGGDKSITTNATTTIESLKKSLDLLCSGGLCTIICYCGHGDIGSDEQAKVEQFLLQQDPRIFRITKNNNILFKESPILYSIYKFKVKRPPYMKKIHPQSVFIERIKKLSPTKEKTGGNRSAQEKKESE